jgi:hypothetical protein
MQRHFQRVDALGRTLLVGATLAIAATAAAPATHLRQRRRCCHGEHERERGALIHRAPPGAPPWHAAPP